MRAGLWRSVLGVSVVATGLAFGTVGSLAGDSDAAARSIAESFAKGERRKAPAGALRIVEPAARPGPDEEQRLIEEIDMLERARAEAEERREILLRSREDAERQGRPPEQDANAQIEAENQQAADAKRKSEEALLKLTEERERTAAAAAVAAEAAKEAAAKRAAEVEKAAELKAREMAELKARETAELKAREMAELKAREAVELKVREDAELAQMEADREAEADRIEEALRQARAARAARNASPEAPLANAGDQRETRETSTAAGDTTERVRAGDTMAEREADERRVSMQSGDAGPGWRAPAGVGIPPPTADRSHSSNDPRDAHLADRSSTRVAVLMVMEPGTRGIRRGHHTADPVLCGERGCYISAGAGSTAELLPMRKALGAGRTLGSRAGACRNELGCIFRGVDLVAYPAIVQPVDMRLIKHDRRQPQVVHEASACRLTERDLRCEPILGPDYVMWIVPEAMAEAAGSDVLERAVEAGLGEASARR